MNELFVLKFVISVIQGKHSDLVVFGPPIKLPAAAVEKFGCEYLSLEAWLPKSMNAVKGAEVIGQPEVMVKPDANVRYTYEDKDGQKQQLKTPRLTVNVTGEFSFKGVKKISLGDFLNS